MRRVLEDRPPQERPGGEVADVLEMEKRVVLECGVVKRGQVPQKVGRKPEPEGDRWPGEQPDRADSADRGGKCRWDAENEKGRSPLGQDDVLEQVGRKEVVGQRVERCDRGDKEKQASGGEGRETPPLRLAPTDSDAIGERNRDDWQRRLEMERPGVWVRTADRATLVAGRGRSSMVEPQPSKLVMRVRSPPPALSSSRLARRARSSPGCAGGRWRRAPPARSGRRRPSPPSHARTPCACRQATMPPRR
jgi:hypothetical protein